MSKVNVANYDFDPNEIQHFLISIANKAGEMILSAKPSTGSTGSKKNSVDLVTETDQAVEKMVSTSLRERYPNFKFMGEETYKPGDKLTNEPTFIVDPIDGTTNFVHSFPYFCISLGFAVNKEPTVGVVYNPYTKQLYSAIKGRGAFLNGKTQLPLKDPEPLALQDALIVVEYGSDRSGNDYKVKHETFTKLAQSKDEGGAMVHSLRCMGSAALNLCGVASGFLDAWWEAGCWPWDVCAGTCILKEAGGIMVDANPGEWNEDMERKRYFAVRKGEKQDEFVKEFWSFVQGRFEDRHL